MKYCCSWNCPWGQVHRLQELLYAMDPANELPTTVVHVVMATYTRVRGTLLHARIQEIYHAKLQCMRQLMPVTTAKPSIDNTGNDTDNPDGARHNNSFTVA